MKADVKESLSNKLQKEYGIEKDCANSKSEEILRECPPLLLKNVCEWAESRPLSDIYVGRYSLPMIFSIWGRKDFVGALEIMMELLQGDVDLAERRIWRMQR